MTLALRYAAHTDVGLGPKTRNEDSGYAGPHLLAIADGMGGTVGGDVASAITITTVRALDKAGHNEPLRALGQAAVEANSRIAARIDTDPHLEGMGTTLTAILVQDGLANVAHIGDSRAYHFRAGRLRMITRDHTFVQSLIDEGRITLEEAEHHPHRSLIMRALEGRQDARPDLDRLELEPGDRLLVCSDGLDNAAVKDDAIADVLRRSAGPQEAADALIALALDQGSPDNVTCVVADVVDVSQGAADAPTLIGTAVAAPAVVGAAAEPDNQVLDDSAFEHTAALRPGPIVHPASRQAHGLSGDGLPHGESDLEEELRYAPRPPRRFRWLSRIVVAVVVLGLLGTGGRWAYGWTQDQYYVGPFPTDAQANTSNARVAIFRGISQQIPGVPLSHVYEMQSFALSKLPSYQRQQVADTIPADSLSHAREIVGKLRNLAQQCAPAPTQSPTPTPSKTPDPSPTAGKKPTTTSKPTKPAEGAASPSTTPRAGDARAPQECDPADSTPSPTSGSK
ncbi:protein phosphatase 2C domain-containing protein [Actinopolymorpha sp. B11F2]|uniref:protein phosphatase 2C domain-containing protein n=1 Tax=Actinopolymorpha sp. B11F2 TaxID=3160862 RepID=UPI0032E4EAE8